MPVTDDDGGEMGKSTPVAPPRVEQPGPPPDPGFVLHASLWARAGVIGKRLLGLPALAQRLGGEPLTRALEGEDQRFRLRTLTLYEVLHTALRLGLERMEAEISIQQIRDKGETP